MTGALPALLLLALAPIASAWAHAALLGSEPPDGSVLAAAPAEVALQFGEPVAPISFRLLGSGGAPSVPLAGAVADDGRVRAPLPADLGRGGYLLSYRVTSADGHPVTGTIAFAIGEVGLAPARPAAAGGGVSSAVARWVFYVALFGAVGGALFRLLIADLPSRLRRSLAAIAVVGVLAALLQVGARGTMLADSGLVSAAAWSAGMRTSLLPSMLVCAVALLACAATLLRDGRTWRVLGGIAAVVVVAGLPLSGHTATAVPRLVAALALAGHVLAVAVWVGAFVPLLAALGRGSPAGVPVEPLVRRFSAVAVVAVGVLAMSGMLLAVLLIPSPGALVQSSYGWLLLGKLALVGGMLGFATWNRLRLTPRLPAAASHLRVSIAVECAMGVMVVAVTAVLSATPPPRAARLEPQRVEIDAGHRHAVIEIAPGRAGWNQISITLRQHGGAALSPKEFWLVLRQDAAGIAAIRRRLTADAAGTYVLSGPELAVPGVWRCELELLLSDYDQIVLSADVMIQ